MSARTEPPLDWSVVGTLAWFGGLGRPLRRPELERLLLGRRATGDELKRCLKNLDRLVTVRDGYYSLRGDEVRYPTQQTDRWIRYKWWRAHVAAGLLRHLPYVRMVAVANTLADRTADRDSDIDVLVVLRQGRLFLGRLLVTVLLQAAGLRRHGRKITNRICLSFYVTTAHLNLADIAFAPYDIYLWYWISELRPVLAAPGTVEAFHQANRWVDRKVPNRERREPPVKRPSLPARVGERVLDLVAGPLERRLSRWQLARIDTQPRPDEPDVRIIATDTMLKFHEKERRRLYREQWASRMRELGYDPGLIATD